MNDVERWQRVRQLLDQAIGCDAHERAALLDRECGSDSELRSEVESLVSCHQQAGSNFLRKPVIDVWGGSALRATAIADRQTGLSAGTTLGEYEVIGLIASGGMGEVYRARDTRLQREVAVKVLPSALLHDQERLRRFEQEARATAALNHPNILAIFQMGIHEGAPYLVSELLDGVTLREHLARGPIPFRRAI
jgi:serine/threonine protein kinase